MKNILLPSLIFISTYLHAQSINTDTSIKNLEYVIVKDGVGKHKLMHVQMLIKRNGRYYYENMFPVWVLAYKQKDSAVVVVKSNNP